MKHIFLSRNILFIILVFSVFSCTSDLDFEQANEFKAQPVFTANLAYVKGNAPDFVENGIEIPFFSYEAEVDFFDSSFVNDNLTSADLYFKIKNSINKAFTIEIDLKDDSDNIVKKIKIDVPASVDGSDVLPAPAKVTLDGTEARRTTLMVFSVTMLSGPPLTESSFGKIELSSSITAYFDIK